MARGDQLGRQWKIIQVLQSSRNGMPAAEMAEKLGCHKRTIYRDLEALQIAGFPIYTDQRENRRFWSLLDTSRHQAPIPFTITELMALYFSRDMLKIFRDTVFYESLESLFEKIKTTLAPEYLDYLKRLEDTIRVEPNPHGKFGRYRDVIHLANQAALERKYVQIRYYSLTRKSESTRKVAPYKIWFFNGIFYMVGYCDLRQDIRIFALDRVKEIRVTEATFTIPDDFSFQKYMNASFGVFRGKAETVKIRFSENIAHYIREKTWHETQRITSDPAGGIIFTADVAVTADLKAWILGWGSQAVVLEPESLKLDIRKEVGKMNKTATDGRSD